MNDYFKKDITGPALKQILLKFIPQQFIKNVNLSELGFDDPKRLRDGGVQLLQKLMDKATDDIRMYRTAKKLATDLQKYQLFTSSHKYFGMNITEEYPDMCHCYRSEKNEQFVCKQDLLVLVKSVFFDTFPDPTRLGRAMVMIYFKSCEEKLNGRLEFIKYEEEFFDKFLEPCVEALAPDEELLKDTKILPPVEELFDQWKEWLPGLTEEQYESVLEALKTNVKQFPIECVELNYSNVQKYVTAANRCRKHLLMLQKMFASCPEIFLPNPSNAPIVVRLFEYGKLKFVMKTELNQAFASIDSSFEKWTTDELNGFLPAIYFEQIEQDFGHLISKIHFIAFPIDDPSTNPPIPIITPSGSFCVYGRLASTYILMYLCIVLKVFQKAGRKKWPLIVEFMNWYAFEFSSVALQHFMTMEKLEYALQYASDFFKELESVEAKYIVRDWNKEYTLNDLRSDLQYTGLAYIFPNIEEHAERVYQETKMMNKVDRLECSEMFTLIGLCQVTAIVKLKSASGFLNQLSSILNQKEHLEPKSSPKIEHAAPEHSPSTLSKTSSKNSEVVVKNDTGEEKHQKGTEATDKMIGLKMQLNYSLQREKDLKNEMKQKESEYELEASKNKQIIEELKENAEKSKETIKRLSGSKMQLENKVSNVESKLDAERKKTKDYEKSAKQREIDLIQILNATESTYKKEISDNKKVIADLRSVEKKSNETIKILSDSNSKLTNKVSNLESQMRTEQQKTMKLEQAASVEHSKQQKEITENNRIVNELTEILNQNTSKIHQLESQIEVERVLKNSLEDELAKKNETIAELTNSHNQIIGRNGQLEFILEREQQRSQELAQITAPMLQRMASGQFDIDLEQEISEIKKVNSQLRETNSKLTGQVEQQNMVIKSFFNEFGQARKSYSSSSCQTTPEEFTSGYTGVKHHLWSLQKIKDSFRNGKQLKQAKEMMEKLSNQPEIQEMATYELQQYEAQLHHYIQSIEVNIQKIKKTGECTQLDPIPDLPAFSDRFLKEYWKQIDSKNSESEIPGGSPEDIECLICLIEMTPEEKTTKCENCRKVLHSECASEWLRRHRSCPHCRRELLDPTEFPPLS